MLLLESISKTFHPGTPNERIALDNVSLYMPTGDFVTVIGGNGAGKSTIMNLYNPYRVKAPMKRTNPEKGLNVDPGWVEILAPQKTGPDREHTYGADVLKDVQAKVYTHAKLVMIPDGGIKRFRVFGKRRSL